MRKRAYVGRKRRFYVFFNHFLFNFTLCFVEGWLERSFCGRFGIHLALCVRRRCEEVCISWCSRSRVKNFINFSVLESRTRKHIWINERRDCRSQGYVRNYVGRRAECWKSTIGINFSATRVDGVASFGPFQRLNLSCGRIEVLRLWGRIEGMDRSGYYVRRWKMK